MLMHLFAILFAVQCATATISLDCRYVNHGWVALGSVYTCNPRVTQLGTSRNVVGVSQNHMSGRTNLDVRGVNFQNQRIDFIPTDMNRFFPNLEGILFNECPIRSFSREDLRPFPRLRDFSIHRGELTTVSGDVFQHAPGLQFANLGRNSIANVGPGIFQGTPRLVEARFNNNWCINTQARNRAALDLLFSELAFRCPSTAEMTEDFILNGENFRRAVNNQVAPELQQLREENRRANERIEVLEGFFVNLCTNHAICL